MGAQYLSEWLKRDPLAILNRNNQQGLRSLVASPQILCFLRFLLFLSEHLRLTRPLLQGLSFQAQNYPVLARLGAHQLV